MVAKKNGLLKKVAEASDKAINGKRKQKAGHFKQERGKDSIEFDSLSGSIRTLDELLAYAKVDLEQWDVERFVVNQWEMGSRFPDGTTATTPLFQVKAWLKRKGGWTPTEFRRRVVDEVKAASAFIGRKSRHQKRSCDKDCYLYEISIFDHHVGKLCWAKETGHNYDLKIAESAYMAAVEDLVGRVSGQPIERILFPIGNDFLHADNARGTTTRGTPQDVDGRWQYAFIHAERMVLTAIERMREIVPVDVIVVPGNHDHERMFYLGEVVAASFHKAKDVHVNNSPDPRKYYKYGITLLGFTHGSEEKHNDLPRLMADEVPKLWGESHHREFHLGHLHKKKETRFVTTDTHGETIVRILPSLTGTDAWHHSQGYGAPRGSEAYLWGRDKGYCGHYYSRIAEAA